MTLPRTIFEVRKTTCQQCGDSFKTKLDRPGAPAKYCLRCRKDYRLHPGASRKARRKIRDGMNREAAHRQARQEILDQVLGPQIADAGEES